MEHLFTSESIISFFILVVLEVVLGIDNVIFVSIIMNRLKNKKDQKKARRVWMVTGIISRSLLLLGLGWLLAQEGKAVFTLYGKGFDLASIVMLLGGLFLIYKSVKEIHSKLEGEDPNADISKNTGLSFGQAILQIMLIDAVFSFDSIITAVGLSNQLVIMVLAVTIAMFVMILFAPYVSDFINKYPTIKMLALTFLVAIGIILVVESLHLHVNKTYIYVAMAFSIVVELLNIRLRNISMSKVKRS